MAPNATSDVQFSAMVFSYNEARRLRQCLERLSFCEQVLLIDLGSTDGCREIGRECGAEVVQHAHVPIVEHARAEMLPMCRHDWIITVDPDEVLPQEIGAALRAAIAANADAALVTMCFQYYFRGKALNGTRWSVIRKAVASNKTRVRMSTSVHSAFEIAAGFRPVDLPDTGVDGRAQHFWVDSYGQLFEKHNRYLKFEGEARYKNGDRFSLGAALWDVLRSLKNNLIKDRGVFCGFDGIFLSFFHAWYVLNSHLSLRRYQRQQLANAAAGNVPVQS